MNDTARWMRMSILMKQQSIRQSERIFSWSLINGNNHRFNQNSRTATDRTVYWCTRVQMDRIDHLDYIIHGWALLIYPPHVELEEKGKNDFSCWCIVRQRTLFSEDLLFLFRFNDISIALILILTIFLQTSNAQQRVWFVQCDNVDVERWASGTIHDATGTRINIGQLWRKTPCNGRFALTLHQRGLFTDMHRSLLMFESIE